PGQDQVDAHRVRVGDGLDVRPAAARAPGGRDGDGPRPVRLRVGPVIELLLAAPRGQSADVRPVAVALLERLLRDVAALVVVVLVLLGDAEVDERAVPEVAEAHVCRDGNSLPGRPGNSPPARKSAEPTRT